MVWTWFWFDINIKGHREREDFHFMTTERYINIDEINHSL